MLRVALFHDNFAQMGGAERVSEALFEALPGSDVLTTLAVEEKLSPRLKEHGVRTSWMQRLPSKAKFFRHYFLLYPFAIETADLSKYDLVVSSCFGFAKGIRRAEGAIHVCYCHTPMRWVWRSDDYFAKEGFSKATRSLLNVLLRPLRWWEIRASKRPDFYIANSETVAERLKTLLGIDSIVIPPPIETSRFQRSEKVDDYFLVLSRLVPYKRLDLAIRAATEMSLPLKVVGGGPDLERLKAMAGPTVEFLGRLPDAAVNSLVSRCQALLFTGEEDFGMAPLEVNAAGRPVIAFYGGGAKETVVEGTTGLFFREPTVASLKEALAKFKLMRWDPAAIQAHAMLFDTAVFQRRIRAVLNQLTDGKLGRLEVDEEQTQQRRIA